MAKVHIEKDNSALSLSLAKFVAERSNEAVAKSGVFHIAVSGGPSPSLPSPLKLT